MAATQVLITGAGPTGLVLALFLARQGIVPRILERSSGPGEASRAMAVQARTLEFYDQLGLAEQVVAEGVRAETLHLREGGEEVARLAFADLGGGALSPFPFMLCYPQDDHERFLVARLREAGVEVEWDTELLGFTQHADGVRATLRRRGAEESAEAAYLCGCDGAHSRVREGLGLGFPGGTYEQLFYVADIRIEGGFTRDLFVNLDTDLLALLLPVRSSGMQRLIGLVPREVAGRPDIGFEAVRPVAERLVGIRVAEVNWFSTYRVHHRVAARFREGRCFLAGDAGHIHSPAGGQGMNTGIGDAVNLAWKLAQVLRGRAAPALLESYEPERIGFARSLVESTDRAFRSITGSGPGSQILRRFLMPHLLPFLWGFSAARRVMFRTISQVRIAYHDSPLSEGAAGEVQGGDRLPWVAEVDNFAPLRSLDWQLHVHGEAAPALTGAARELGVALHAFPWTGAAAAAGLARDAAMLVRPDGHVALAMARQDPAALRSYAERHGLHFGMA
ncbi:MAG TPA: FAD-dependent monooxygenase [Crenalkalicoccus sp.]|jgi:2-polyprenyl-6-methoxyphenol hydroxylase-like FAD-dependent oxidoreductase|nr:FAD-dependent monooxygenase [Crenalkalicoccus sp.]